MPKIWMIYTLMFGYGVPTKDEAVFTNESACQIYLHTHYDPTIQEAFKVICVDISPLVCQDKLCGE